MPQILRHIALEDMHSMSDLLEALGIVVLVLLVLFIFFIFYGDPDIWDLAHKTVLRKLQ